MEQGCIRLWQDTDISDIARFVDIFYLRQKSWTLLGEAKKHKNTIC